MKEANNRMNALIFDVKRYAVHDGPGIRTAVFFKGCPLNCLWCHNPEGIERFPEILYRPGICGRCFACLNACPNGALRKDDSKALTIARELCNGCGLCVEGCPYDALQLAGRQVNLNALLGEIERDRIFHDQSGGGVTLTGGEPVLQHEFAICLLRELRNSSIHSALDTSGYAPEDLFHRVALESDIILYDLKLMDDEKHREVTGVSNELIIKNLKWAANSGLDLVIRIPLIPGINDNDHEIRNKAEFLATLENIRYVNILPYHRGGEEKARRLGRTIRSRGIEIPSEEKLSMVLKIFRDYGFEAKVGG